jgi:predicted enzyme related to lactoylglutathione lyase
VKARYKHTSIVARDWRALAATRVVLEHGGSHVGEAASTTVPGVGRLTVVYLADPEGNIIELQAWG